MPIIYLEIKHAYHTRRCLFKENELLGSEILTIGMIR